MASCYVCIKCKFTFFDGQNFAIGSGICNSAVFIFTISFFITSCSDGWDSVKRGITGAKKNSVDEFLVQKKDPLVLPPNYEDLPTPDEQEAAEEQVSSIEKTLSSVNVEEDNAASEDSAESSILKKIKKN